MQGQSSGTAATHHSSLSRTSTGHAKARQVIRTNGERNGWAVQNHAYHQKSLSFLEGNLGKLWETMGKPSNFGAPLTVPRWKIWKKSLPFEPLQLQLVINVIFANMVSFLDWHAHDAYIYAHRIAAVNGKTHCMCKGFHDIEAWFTTNVTFTLYRSTFDLGMCVCRALWCHNCMHYPGVIHHYRSHSLAMIQHYYIHYDQPLSSTIVNHYLQHHQLDLAMVTIYQNHCGG